MDSSKVNSLNSALPPQATHATATKQSELLQNRFLLALHAPADRESPEQPTGASWLPPAPTLALSRPPKVTTSTASEANVELAGLLDQVCSAMYVGERSSTSQRIVLTLDHILPGAAAEIVREGAHLIVRLHARTENSYRLMSLQREALLGVLGRGRGEYVDAVVIRDQEAQSALSDGDG